MKLNNSPETLFLIPNVEEPIPLEKRANAQHSPRLS